MILTCAAASLTDKLALPELLVIACTLDCATTSRTSIVSPASGGSVNVNVVPTIE